MTFNQPQLQAQKFGNKTSTLGSKGENLLSNKQFVSGDFAQLVSNFEPLAEARMVKTKGSVTEFENSTIPFSAAVKVGTEWYYALGADIIKYDGGGNTVLNTSPATGDFAMEAYGQWIYFCNGSQTLAYIDTSDDSDVVIATAPKCDRMFIIGDRLYTNDVDVDGKVASPATGTAIPFTTWATAEIPALVTDYYETNYLAAGTVRAFGVIGRQINTFYSTGESGVTPTTINVDTLGLRLDTQVDYQRQSVGGNAAVSTPQGIYLVKDSGIFLRITGGLTDQPTSKQEVNISPLYPEEFWLTLDLTESDIHYDETGQRILVSCKSDSDFHNLTLIYDIEEKTWARKPWNVSKFIPIEKKIYGLSSIEGKLLELFEGYSDDGLPIKCEFEQELTQGDILNLNTIREVYANGILAPEQVITICFDIYDRDGNFVSCAKTITWNAKTFGSTNEGINNTTINGAINGSGVPVYQINDWLHKKVRLFRYSRLILRISEESSSPLEMNWISLITKPKGRNKLYN